MLGDDSSETPPMRCGPTPVKAATQGGKPASFMAPFSASPEFLEACGLEPRKFMEWRYHAEAAGLDDDWHDVLPVYFNAQAKRAKDYKLGKDAVQDMIVLGITMEGAKRAEVTGWLYGHRSPFEWAEMLVEGLLPAS